MMERYLALYITILFLTDNVIIYQHLMIPYLLLLARIQTDLQGTHCEVSREGSNKEVIVKKRRILRAKKHNYNGNSPCA